jgi:hypothetical protein
LYVIGKTDKAYIVFKRIASSNKRTILNELETIKTTHQTKKAFKLNEVMPMVTISPQVGKELEVKRKKEANNDGISTEHTITVNFLFLI